MTYMDAQVFTLVESALFNLNVAKDNYFKKDTKLRVDIAIDLLQSVLINMRSEK